MCVWGGGGGGGGGRIFLWGMLIYADIFWGKANKAG